MKILIIGKDSYIGNHIDQWLTSKGLSVTQLDVLTDEWKAFDYSPFNAIVHVAGIVHQPQCKDWELYRRVNAEMPFEICQKAKEQGVSQYVFFSTMGVYGIDKKLEPNIINTDTPLLSEGMYGKSKLMAEQALAKLQDESFNVAFVRPPSVYGKGCRGNYIAGFTSFVKKLPVIPLAYQNVRQSMLYIDNLSELVYQIVDKNLSGVFCPQDERAVNANEILYAIGEGIGKRVRQSRLLGFMVRLVSFIPLVKKAYGGIEYSKSLSDIDGIDYRVVSFKEGMHRTVGNYI